MERIASTAQRARDSAGLVTDLRPGLREAVVFAACPAQADAPALVAWTLMRVPLISADVVNPLILAVSLLLGMVLASGLWLGRMLRRWQRQSAQMEQQLLSAERLATLGRLSAGLAHEIRNPLGTMRMKAETALAAPAPLREARSQGALEAVLAQTARLEDLVSSLLALTQPFRVQPEPVDVQHLLDERLQAHAELAQARGVQLATAVSAGLARDLQDGRRPLLDPVQMARALDNLLLNALAHTAAGGGWNWAQTAAAPPFPTATALCNCGWQMTARALRPSCATRCSSPSPPRAPAAPGWDWRWCAKSCWPMAAASRWARQHKAPA